MYPCQSLAPIAQSAERLHGKEKVYGSIPYWGSVPGVVALGVHGGAARQVGSAVRRSSSVRQSKRLIIAVSPVQIRPPLPAPGVPGRFDVCWAGQLP